MIAYVEIVNDTRWLVVLDERGDLIYRRQVAALREAEGVLAPIVTGEMYEDQRSTPQKRPHEMTPSIP